ncbi:hypothetical protein [Streptomyces sp. AK04-3B]|nr:hypothetical protein [Streptomyces sp. AK04-3B]MDX3802903.1 hypothetical protein [Streptomyces sp. AK04-3B]
MPYRFYAKIFKGGQQQSDSLIACALGEGEQPALILARRWPIRTGQR